MIKFAIGLCLLIVSWNDVSVLGVLKLFVSGYLIGYSITTKIMLSYYRRKGRFDDLFIE